MSFDETIQFFFLLLPYYGLVNEIKKNYGKDKAEIFTLILENFISQMDKDVLFQALSIATQIDIDTLKNKPFREVVAYIPIIIKVNNLIETYFLLKQYGIFNV